MDPCPAVLCTLVETDGEESWKLPGVTPEFRLREVGLTHGSLNCGSWVSDVIYLSIVTKVSGVRELHELPIYRVTTQGYNASLFDDDAPPDDTIQCPVDAPHESIWKMPNRSVTIDFSTTRARINVEFVAHADYRRFLDVCRTYASLSITDL